MAYNARFSCCCRALESKYGRKTKLQRCLASKENNRYSIFTNLMFIMLVTAWTCFKSGFHLIVPIAPIVPKQDQAIATIILVETQQRRLRRTGWSGRSQSLGFLQVLSESWHSRERFNWNPSNERDDRSDPNISQYAPVIPRFNTLSGGMTTMTATNTWFISCIICDKHKTGDLDEALARVYVELLPPLFW